MRCLATTGCVDEHRDTFVGCVQYTEADEERKRLLEEVLNLKGAVRVFCRVRPFTPEEMSRPDGSSAHRLFLFPGTSKDCTAIQIAEPPAPGVDGRLKPSKITEFGFNKCVAISPHSLNCRIAFLLCLTITLTVR